MQSVPLDKTRHQRKKFDCGVEALNNYLKLMANQHASRDNSRTYVLEDSQNEGVIVGFYTLTMVTVDLSSLPKPLQNKHPHNQTAGLIARLAVDKHYTGRGIGSWLFIDALIKLLNASDIVGFPMVIVDAKEGMGSFYEQFGFQAFSQEKERLFMTVADIRVSFGDGS